MKKSVAIRKLIKKNEMVKQRSNMSNWGEEIGMKAACTTKRAKAIVREAKKRT